MMNIVHLTTDLMLGSQVSQAARGRGMSVRMVGTLERLAEQIDSETVLVLLDLQTAGWSTERFQQLVSGRTLPPIAAYAQHVFPQLLADARQIGISSVLTRGQFASSLPRLLADLPPIKP